MKDINTFINAAQYKREISNDEFDELYPDENLVDSSSAPVHVKRSTSGDIEWVYDDEFDIQYYSDFDLL